MAALPVGVSGSAHGTWRNQLYLAGGTTWEAGAKRTLDAVWLFDHETHVWKEHARLPRPHAYGANTIRGADLIIAAGTAGADARADVWSVAADGASHRVAMLPQPSAYCGGILVEQSLFILGGLSDPQDPSTATDAFISLDLESGEVEALPPFPGGARIHPALAEAGGFVYVFPGGGYDAAPAKFTHTRAAWRYGINKRQWERLSDYPIAVRGLAVAPLDPRHILVGGGYAARRGEAAFTDACWIYDTKENQYHPLPPLPYTAMQMAFITHRDFVYVLGGEDRPQQRSKQVYRVPAAMLLKAINR